MRKSLPLLVLVSSAFAGCAQIPQPESPDSSNINEQKTASFYNSLVSGSEANISQLKLFFTQMPKGGDLHHHYSGSLYVETYLDWAKENGQLIDKETFRVSNDETKQLISVDELRADNALYRKLLTVWSDYDFYSHYHEQLPPDSNFFNTFAYFGDVKGDYVKGLTELKARAIKENVSYIETMLKSVGYSNSDESFDEKIKAQLHSTTFNSLLDAQATKLEQDALLADTVNKFIQLIQSTHEQVGLDGEQFMMRYQTYTSRNSSPSKVFSALYAAFKAARASDLIVGVNLVGPENGVVAIADYELHMQFFAYLRKRFPEINVALHAGELTLGMVRPKNLTFHITQAIQIAGAQRIGHGVDLPYEEKSVELLQLMKEKSAVEINLTSNEFILGVKDQAHPYMIYSAYGVPMVIATDDSGVSRNNLSGEYVLLATRYKPSYATVKEYVFNSVRYAFLPEDKKAQLMNSVQQRFDSFEAKMADYTGKLQ